MQCSRHVHYMHQARHAAHPGGKRQGVAALVSRGESSQRVEQQQHGPEVPKILHICRVGNGSEGRLAGMLKKEEMDRAQPYGWV